MYIWMCALSQPYFDANRTSVSLYNELLLLYNDSDLSKGAAIHQFDILKFAPSSVQNTGTPSP